MKIQLQRLLLLQEIDALLQDFAEGGALKAEERLGFSFGSLASTRMKRTKIAHSLDPAVLLSYEQVRRRHVRAVAPVRGGICLGCFTVRPTKSAHLRHGLETCEHCGRILFRLEERSQPAETPPSPSRAARKRSRR